MSIAVLLVLAALMILLLRRSILRRRRQRLGLPVSGPWHLPEWLNLRLHVERWLGRRRARKHR